KKLQEKFSKKLFLVLTEAGNTDYGNQELKEQIRSFLEIYLEKEKKIDKSKETYKKAQPPSSSKRKQKEVEIIREEKQKEVEITRKKKAKKKVKITRRKEVIQRKIQEIKDPEQYIDR
ncbi:33783_t:CDS:1, partial [Gigaspora margarita]